MAISTFLVAIILISSSSMSITLDKSSEPKNLDLKVIEEEKESLVNQLTGLDPNSQFKNPNFKSELNENYIRERDGSINTQLMYGFVAYGGSSGEPEGPCYFPLDDPGDITSLAPWTEPNFLAGGTWTCDEEWFGCEYYSGCLWRIDPETGDM